MLWHYVPKAASYATCVCTWACLCTSHTCEIRNKNYYFCRVSFNHKWLNFGLLSFPALCKPEKIVTSQLIVCTPKCEHDNILWVFLSCTHQQQLHAGDGIPFIELLRRFLRQISGIVDSRFMISCLLFLLLLLEDLLPLFVETVSLKEKKRVGHCSSCQHQCANSASFWK